MSQPVDLCRRHLVFGWWSLLIFLSLGVLLEAMHGFKLGIYVDLSNATRRLMWTLCHAHGTLLSLIHIAFALTLRAIPLVAGGWQEIASPCLLGSSVLLPGGFFLGGVITYSGDPSLGVLLVPVGAALLAISVFLTARGVRDADRTAQPN